MGGLILPSTTSSAPRDLRVAWGALVLEMYMNRNEKRS